LADLPLDLVEAAEHPIDIERIELVHRHTVSEQRLFPGTLGSRLAALQGPHSWEFLVVPELLPVFRPRLARGMHIGIDRHDEPGFDALYTPGLPRRWLQAGELLPIVNRIVDLRDVALAPEHRAVSLGGEKRIDVQRTGPGGELELRRRNLGFHG